MERLAILLVFVLAFAGCGGSGDLSEPEVEQRAGDARVQVEQSLEQLAGAGLTGELAARLEETADRLRQTAEELDPGEEGDVPEDAQPAVRRLEDGLERLAEQLDDAAAEAPGGDLVDRLRAFDVAALDDVREALAELRDRGYDVGRLDA